MLGSSPPDGEMVTSIRKKIGAGNHTSVLEDMSRICPGDWEVAIVDDEPLPGCYAWLFGAFNPAGVEVFVVMRLRLPAPPREFARREEKASKRAPVPIGQQVNSSLLI